MPRKKEEFRSLELSSLQEDNHLMGSFNAISCHQLEVGGTMEASLWCNRCCSPQPLFHLCKVEEKGCYIARSLINLEGLIGWISQVATLLLTVDLQPNIIDIIGTFENAFFAQDSFSTKLTFIYIVCLTWSEPSSSSEARIQPTQNAR